MAARRADERRTRPIIRALEAGCGWLEEPVPLSVGREGAWPGGQGLGRGQEGRFPDTRAPAQPAGSGTGPLPLWDASELRPRVAAARQGAHRVGVAAQFSWLETEARGRKLGRGGGRGRGSGRARERQTHGGGERRGERRGESERTQKWRDAKRKIHVEKQRGRNTHRGAYIERERDRGRIGGETETT